MASRAGSASGVSMGGGRAWLLLRGRIDGAVIVTSSAAVLTGWQGGAEERCDVLGRWSVVATAVVVHPTSVSTTPIACRSSLIAVRSAP